VLIRLGREEEEGTVVVKGVVVVEVAKR